jgi:hypothetical protein
MKAPNWQPWLVFFLRSLAEQALSRASHGLQLERPAVCTMASADPSSFGAVLGFVAFEQRWRE